MIIYKTTNLENGKIYIGKDVSNKPSYIGSGKILKSAIKKYGKKSFIKETIDTATTHLELEEKEKMWIEKYNSRDQKIGYNITEGGTGGDVFTNNPNKEKIREKFKNIVHKKGFKHSEETKKKLSDMFKGRKLTDEWKEKISKKLIEITNNEDYKKKLSESMTGKKLSDEWKMNISKSKIGDKNPMKKEENKNKLRGIVRSEESNEKNRQSHLGKKSTEETKEKIRQSMLKFKQKQRDEKNNKI